MEHPIYKTIELPPAVFESSKDSYLDQVKSKNHQNLKKQGTEKEKKNNRIEVKPGNWDGGSLIHLSK